MTNKKEPMTRSENMARIAGSNTKPEIYLRKILWSNGIRYRINYIILPGKPDIYVATSRTAIFVNGCFWHMHHGCKFSTIPKTNTLFWSDKLHGNVSRDLRVYEELEALGIKVIVVWGCEVKNMIKDAEFRNEYISCLLEKLEENRNPHLLSNS